jgi:uncharacterized protein Usg
MDNYYGCMTSLAWILNHYFYLGKHYCWVAAEFNTYRLNNPKSSNPYLIYDDIFKPWKDKDDFDKYICQLRLDLIKGVNAQQSDGVISTSLATRLKNICRDIEIVFLYPIVYRVDKDKINTGRLQVSGSGLTAGSSEYLIPDLDESTPEFDIIYLDYDTDPDFKVLIVDEFNGVRSTSQKSALKILRMRC